MKRGRKWAIGLLLVLVGLPAFVVGTALWRARRALEEHRKECEAILALPRPGGRTRPAIFEPEEPGNAWDIETGLLRDDLTSSIVVRAEGAQARMDILDDFDGVEFSISGINPSLTSTWRDLGSETLCKARRVVALRRAYGALEGIERLPTWEQEREAERKLEKVDVRVCDPGECPDPLLYRAEAASLLHLTLFRVALALARYESEQGAFPGTLQGLVPAYLPSVPPCPFTGEPLRYEKGRVRAEDAAKREQARGESALFRPEETDWTVRRR